MKKLLNVLMAVLLFLIPNVNYGQAPNLGTAANFVLFTSVGAVTNTGITMATGNVGTNSGSTTGFGNVNGQMHDNDGVTGTCATDLLIAYHQLDTATPTFFPAPLIGNGDTLVAGVYHITSVATLSGNLILNAHGNANAVFIFQIQAAFSTNAASKVILINGAKACNVFWKVEGLVSMAAGTNMKGTIIANNAAINMNAGDTLEGRALSTTGAVLVDNIMAYTPIGCGSPLLTGPIPPPLASTAYYAIFSADGPVTNSGATHIVGDVGTNVGLTTGFNPLFVTGTIHPIPDGSTAACAADLATVYSYLNTLPVDITLLYPAQFGHNLVLTPHTYLLDAATTLTDSVYLNAEGDVNAVFVIKINGALSTSSFAKVIMTNGTQAKNVYWKVEGAIDISDHSIIDGTLVANNGAITFNTGDSLNGRAFSTTGAILIGAMNAIAFLKPGLHNLIGDSTVCVGSTITLSDSSSSSGIDTGGVWHSTNSKATVLNGVVTGVTAGIDTILYVFSNQFGSDTASKIITVNPLPSAEVINGAASVCLGTTITLSDIISGGTWNSSNSRATVVGGVVTGVATGIDTIKYIVSNSCGIDTAIKIISINTIPNAGTILGSSNVCTGSTLTLSNATGGGTWNSTNTRATVVGGIVTGVTPGIDTIRYIVSNSCGADTVVKSVNVITIPNSGTINGTTSVCIGSTITLTDATSGGTWGSTNAKATVSAGIVTGVSIGLDTIRYIVTNGCGTDTATKTITVNAASAISVINGATSVCAGSIIILSDTTSGGVWGSSNATATVSGGVVSGIIGGIDTISYAITSACGTTTAIKIITINAIPAVAAISGASSVCVGSIISLTDITFPGTWICSNGNAIVSSAGFVTGVAIGLDTINFIVGNSCGSDTAFKMITINSTSVTSVINGSSTVCIGATITLTDTVSGGTWSISNNKASYIDGIIVFVTGDSVGIDTLNYTVINACGTTTAIKSITVNAIPNAGNINGISSVCVGSTINLTDLATGGTWSRSNPNVSISGIGHVTGVLAGIDTIKYIVTNTCGTDTAIKSITVNPLPNAGTINGSSAICIGSSTTLSDIISGGIWTSSNSTATVIAGVVNGISAGTDTIKYMITNMCGIDTASKIIIINAFPFLISSTMPPAICDSIIFTYIPVSNNIPASYNWTRPAVAGIANSATNDTGKISEMLVNTTADPIAVIYTYTITANGCINSQDISVTVNPTPRLSGLLLEARCSGTPFTYTPTSLTIGTSYIWSRSTVASILPSIGSGSGTVNETLRNSTLLPINVNYLFTATANACLFSQNVVLVVNPVPSVPVITTMSPLTVCAGTINQNFGTSIAPAATVVYSWTSVNATIWATSKNGENAIVNFPNTGNAEVILSANVAGIACKSADTFKLSVGNSNAQVPQVLYFESHFIALPDNEDSYQWGYDDATTLIATTLTGETNQDYLIVNPDIAHKYYWVNTAFSGCLQKTYFNTPMAIQNVNTNGITEVKVYPNPANELLNIEINTTVGSNILVEITNMTGQIVSSFQALNLNAIIDVSHYASGFYIITCYHDGIKISTTRFIKN